MKSHHSTVHMCFESAGVIWRGDSVIDGVPQTLDMLRSMVGQLGALAAAAAAAAAAVVVIGGGSSSTTARLLPHLWHGTSTLKTSTLKKHQLYVLFVVLVGQCINTLHDT